MNRGTSFPVLDHGYVKLIDYMGSDEAVVEAARMSTGKGFTSWDPYSICDDCGQAGINGAPITHYANCDGTPKAYPQGDFGLLDNLWRKRHTTPFECGGELMLEIQAPIMVFREWHRHRTQSYNEFSARYSQMPNLHYIPVKERIQKQSAANKQGSAAVMVESFAIQVITELEGQQQEIYDSYEDWIENGLAKEVARLNTPVSRYSKMRAKTDLKNWLGFCNLRMRPDAQWEIRQYADIGGDILKSLWPMTWSLFEEYDLYGAHLSRTELRTLRELITSFNYTLGGGKNMESMLQAIGEVCKDKGLSGTKQREFVEKLTLGGDRILA